MDQYWWRIGVLKAELYGEGTVASRPLDWLGCQCDTGFGEYACLQVGCGGIEDVAKVARKGEHEADRTPSRLLGMRNALWDAEEPDVEHLEPGCKGSPCRGAAGGGTCAPNELTENERLAI